MPKWSECIAARARIESERIRAQKEFVETRQQEPPAGWSTATHDLYAFSDYVAAVWFALNRELCTLGLRRKWRHIFPADHIRQRSEEFLEGFTTLIAYPEDGRDRHGRPLEGVVESYVRLSRRFQELIKQNKLWDEGKSELKATADHQGGKLRKKTRKKLQASVLVDPIWLMTELNALNAKRAPGDQLKLTAPQLAANSPDGGPHVETWRKLLKGERVRSDVPDHLIAFFERYRRHLKPADIRFRTNVQGV
jgi:hypothetical protein